MTVEQIMDILSNFGFPVACVIAMGAFIFYIYKRTNEREAKLLEELKENRKINSKAISTIAYYAERLDNIQEDIKEIKTDITVIMTKH